MQNWSRGETAPASTRRRRSAGFNLAPWNRQTPREGGKFMRVHHVLTAGYWQDRAGHFRSACRRFRRLAVELLEQRTPLNGDPIATVNPPPLNFIPAANMPAPSTSPSDPASAGAT